MDEKLTRPTARAEHVMREQGVTAGIVRWIARWLLLVITGAAPVHAADVRPAVGHQAPDFTLRDSEGRSVQLSRVLGDKAVLLNFWAMWCPPCREEMPTMERAYREYKAKGLEILAVSIDFGDEAEVAAKVREFMADLKLTFPALLDPRNQVARTYRLRGLPATFLIDRQGVIRGEEIGYRDWVSPESRKKIEQLLK